LNSFELNINGGFFGWLKDSSSIDDTEFRRNLFQSLQIPFERNSRDILDDYLLLAALI
jgi:hypothetical protein